MNLYDGWWNNHDIYVGMAVNQSTRLHAIYIIINDMIDNIEKLSRRTLCPPQYQQRYDRFFIISNF